MSEKTTLNPGEHINFGTNAGWGETIIFCHNPHEREVAHVRVRPVGGDFARLVGTPIVTGLNKVFERPEEGFYEETKKPIKVPPLRTVQQTIKYAGALAEVANVGTQPVQVWTDL